MITDQLSDLVKRALDELAARGQLDKPREVAVDFERPKRREHGDWSTNVALGLRHSGTNPRALAQTIVEALPVSNLIRKAEVAGPGFINFHLSDEWLHDVVRRASDPKSNFGRTGAGNGASVNVEYISANPTGPINVVSGRHAAVGDAIANLLSASGHEVTREFYVNDTGRQITLFGESIAARLLEALGEEAELPEEGYRGDYVIQMAGSIAAERGQDLISMEAPERARVLAQLGVDQMLEQMRASLEAFGTRFDVWFRESSLHDSGALEQALTRLEERGFVERREGALWFLASRLGDDKDRVVIRSNGEPTYLASDVAYLADKFGRGFDHLIYVWGADHHGTVPRLLAAAEALGYERDRVEIPLVQIVTLSRRGKAIKASKRQGVLVPLDELVAEVGADAVRYMFLTRSIDAPLDFDIELAKEQAPENPVYYVQYAHARICSILKKAAEEAATVTHEATLSRLEHPSEDALMRKIASYEEVVPEAARARAPQKMTRYLEELAAVFSAFYRDCRVVTEDLELSQARLLLCRATKSVLADGLGILGVGAPEQM